MRSAKQKNKAYHSSPYDTSDAVVLLSFLVLVVLIVFLYSEAGTTSSIEREQRMLLNKLIIHNEKDDSPAIIVGNVVDATMLNTIAKTDYSQLKKSLGVNAEFVIHFEDQNGNLIEVSDKPCIGSNYAYINGHKCSE